MRELIEQYEFAKETQYIFDGIDDKIIGRIYKVVKSISTKYMWTISHYCRLEGEMDVYMPSAPFGQSLEDIEYSLERYVKRFKEAVDWKVNTSF